MSTFELIEPASGKPLAAVPRATADDVERVVAAAHGAFTAGPWRTIDESSYVNGATFLVDGGLRRRM